MFPSPNEWYDTVLHPEDTHPWDFRQPAFYDEYKQKYAIAKMIRPKSILEIGVRFGYSANSFLMAAPDAEYTGVDFDEPSWGPYKGVPRKWAEKQLKARYPKSSIRTIRADTQKEDMRAQLERRCDLVHIDADHSVSGVLRDMQMFWLACKRVMVVDDVVEIPDVARAVMLFLSQTPDAVAVGASSSLRGSALIVRDT